MNNSQPIKFQGSAGGYFVVFLLTMILSYLPLIGWAIILNYMAGWLADNTMVNGRTVKYQASFGESLKFVFINTIFLIITFGIYIFWFVPKSYRYVADHIHYTDEVAASPVPTETPTPAPPTAQPPAAPLSTPQPPTSVPPSGTVVSG